MNETGNRLFFTPQELVTRWKNVVSQETLANWRSAGLPPAYFEAGGKILYPVRRVLVYERERERQQRREPPE